MTTTKQAQAQEQSKPEATPPPEPPRHPKSLVAKLAEVMGEVERVEKRGRNDFHKYDYATEGDIAAAVRKGLSARSIIVVPRTIDPTLGTVERKNGGGDTLVTLRVVFAFLDGETGQSLEVPVYGQGQDGGDKAFYKALTGAVKYLLLKTFLMPTGDDPEAEAPQQQRGQQQRQQRAQRQEQAPQGQGQQPPAQQAGPPRHTRIWHGAQALGMADAQAFSAFVARVLGGTSKPSKQWTPEDMDKLEAALAAIEEEKMGARGP